MRWHRPFRFGGGAYFGFPPFAFSFRGFRPFPRRREYLRMLEEYKKELEEELREVEAEIEALKKE